MKNRFLLLVFALSCTTFLSAQGGEDAAISSGVPITLPFNANGSTIGKINNYNFPVGFNDWASTGPDWLYYVCAPSTGQMHILLTDMTAVPAIANISASVTVWNGIPGAGGTVVAGGQNFLYAATASSVATQNTLLFNVTAASCYYVMIDNYYSSTDNTSRNGFNYNLTIQMPPASILQSACTNIDFESGALNGWSGTYGHTVVNGAVGAPTPKYIPAFFGTNNVDFAVTSGAGTDPHGGFPVVCPGFGANSVRLGDINNAAPLYSYADKGGASLEQKFTVTASNALFTYNYAAVVEDAGTDHPNEEQPFFRAEVLDCNGVPISCGAYLVTGGPNVPGFIRVGTSNVYYRNWTPVFVDLTDYIGTCVTVKFTTADCSRGAHFGYAYIDAICAPMVITGPTYVCPGTTANLTSPIGGISYSWKVQGTTTVLGTNQNISVTPTAATTTYSCLITSATGCFTTLTFDVLLHPSVTATASSAEICQGSSATISGTGFPSGGTFAWTGGITTSDLTVSPSTTTIYTLEYTGPNNCKATTSGTITVNPLPLPPVVTPVTYCKNQAVVGLVATANSGNTLNWYGTSQTGGTPSNIAPIPNSSIVGQVSYYASQVTADGCESARVALLVTINDLPVVVVNSLVICPNTQATLTASGATTYIWESNAAFNTATYNVSPSVNSTYSVEGTLNGCKSTAIATVTLLNALNVTVNSPTICEGESVDLIQSGGATSVWDSPTQNGVSTSNIFTVSPTVTTSYVVTATLNGCTGTAVSVVTVNPIPSTVASSNSPICEGETLNLTATNSTIPQTTYTWIGPGIVGFSTEQNPVLTNASTSFSGMYTVTVAANGCTSASNVAVIVNPIPLTSVTVNSPICEGETFNFSAESSGVVGEEFLWTGPGFSPNSTISNPTILAATIAMSGTYLVRVSANNCFSTQSVNVVVNPTPITLVASNSPVCSGDNLNLTAAATGVLNTVYEWIGPAFGSPNYSQNPTINSATVGNSGLYSLKVSANGCSSISSLNVVVNETPSIVASVEEICQGEDLNFVSIVSSNVADYIFEWNGPVVLPAVQSPTIANAQVSASGTYTVKVTSSGCSASTSVVAIVNSPFTPVMPQVANPICEASIAPVLPLASIDSPSVVGQWSPSVIDNMNSATYIFTPDSGQCALPVVLDVVVIALPILPQPLVNRICEPGTIDLTDPSVAIGSSGGILTYWINASCSISLANPNSVGVGGTYYIKSTTNTTPACAVIAPVVVQIDPKPIADFTPSPTVVSSLNPYSQMINSSSGAVSFIWDFGDEQTSLLTNPDNYFEGSESGKYDIVLVATSEFGCVDSAFAILTVKEELIFYVPNTFTPDQDDYNEIFLPVFTSGYDPYNYSLLIFNRWGQIVFESHDTSQGWKGTYGVDGDLVQDGTYTWKIDFGLKQTKEMQSLVGHVNVLR